MVEKEPVFQIAGPKILFLSVTQGAAISRGWRGYRWHGKRAASSRTSFSLDWPSALRSSDSSVGCAVARMKIW